MHFNKAGLVVFRVLRHAQGNYIGDLCGRIWTHWNSTFIPSRSVNSLLISFPGLLSHLQLQTSTVLFSLWKIHFRRHANVLYLFGLENSTITLLMLNKKWSTPVDCFSSEQVLCALHGASGRYSRNTSWETCVCMRDYVIDLFAD